MKKINLFLFSVLIAFVFASCDTDAEKAFYEPTEGVELAFSSKTLYKDLVTEDNGKLPVLIHRGKAKGAHSVDITFTSSSPLFTLETSKAEFADGKYETIINILYDFSELSAAETYEMTLQITDTLNLSPVLLNKIDISARQKLEYTSLGVGTFTTEFFGAEYDVEIFKAEGLDLYRIEDTYVEGYDFYFSVDGDNIDMNTQNTGFNHPDYGFISFEPIAVTFLPQKAGISFFGSFIVDIGTFGNFTEVLTFQFP